MGKRKREATPPSAEVTEPLCSVCSVTDCSNPTSWYCKQCRQLLCDVCQRSNCNVYDIYCTRKRVKISASKAHDLIRAGDANFDAPAAHNEPSDQGKSLQCAGHGKPFQFYCRIHSMPACASCKVEDHKDCSGLQNLELAATENTKFFGEVLEHLNAINSSMDDISEAMKEEKKNMETEKAAVIQRITKKIREINAETNKEALVQKEMSNDLGEKHISKVETMFKKEHASIDVERKSLEESKQLVLKKIQELELASMSGSAKEQFLTAKLASMDAGRYYNILCKSSHVMHKNIGISFRDELDDTGSMVEITIDKDITPVFYYHHLVQFINIENGTLVPWMGLLPNKQMILISANDHAGLQLYSPDKNVLSELSTPVLLTAAIHENQLIAPRERETGLHLISIDKNRLTKGQHIETGIEHIAIAKFSETSFLTVNVEPRAGFEIRDLNGNIKTQIPIKEEGIQRPVHVRVNKSSDIIYMVDNEKGCYGFSLQGECLFHFEQKDESLHKYIYTGLATDQEDNLYFTCTKLNEDPEKVISTIVQLSPQGLLKKHLLNVPTIAFPIHCTENKLYISICFPDGRYGEGRDSGVYQMFV